MAHRAWLKVQAFFDPEGVALRSVQRAQETSSALDLERYKLSNEIAGLENLIRANPRHPNARLWANDIKKCRRRMRRTNRNMEIIDQMSENATDSIQTMHTLEHMDESTAVSEVLVVPVREVQKQSAQFNAVKQKERLNKELIHGAITEVLEANNEESGGEDEDGERAGRAATDDVIREILDRDLVYPETDDLPHLPSVYYAHPPPRPPPPPPPPPLPPVNGHGRGHDHDHDHGVPMNASFAQPSQLASPSLSVVPPTRWTAVEKTLVAEY